MKKLTYRVIIGLLLLLLTTTFFGCGKTVYVPVENTRVEYRDKMLYDSIHIVDSIYVKDKGDTIWLTKWRTEYRDRVKTDSVIIRDSIQVPYPVEVIKQVEKELNWWQQFRMYLGNVCLIIIGGWLAWIITKNLIK